MREKTRMQRSRRWNFKEVIRGTYSRMTTHNACLFSGDLINLLVDGVRLHAAGFRGEKTLSKTHLGGGEKKKNFKISRGEN